MVDEAAMAAAATGGDNCQYMLAWRISGLESILYRVLAAPCRVFCASPRV